MHMKKNENYLTQPLHVLLGAAEILLFILTQIYLRVISPAHQRGLVLLVSSHSSKLKSFKVVFVLLFKWGDELMVWAVGAVLSV